jgi:hypothetical protein
MKIVILIAMILGWSLSAISCVDLSGIYQLNDNSCDQEIVPELSIPSDSGKITLKRHSVITIQQKKCDEYIFQIKDQDQIIKKAELNKTDIQFSKYGIIIIKETKKIKKDLENKSIPGRKVSINSQWNLDLVGNGNLVLKFKQEVRNHKLFNQKVKDVKQVCELFNINL